MFAGHFKSQGLKSEAGSCPKGPGSSLVNATVGLKVVMWEPLWASVYVCMSVCLSVCLSVCVKNTLSCDHLGES